GRQRWRRCESQEGQCEHELTDHRAPPRCHVFSHLLDGCSPVREAEPPLFSSASYPSLIIGLRGKREPVSSSSRTATFPYPAGTLLMTLVSSVDGLSSRDEAGHVVQSARRLQVAST